MLTIIVVIFVLAYAAIALEHPIGINKSASALLGVGLLWTVYALSTGDHTLVGHQLNESLASTAQIVFFLMGAMTIVEVVDFPQPVGPTRATNSPRATVMLKSRSVVNDLPSGLRMMPFAPATFSPYCVITPFGSA